MEIKIMAFREVYKLFVDAWELYRKYSARRLDDAECEAMAQEADAINEKYQSEDFVFLDKILVGNYPCLNKRIPVKGIGAA